MPVGEPRAFVERAAGQCAEAIEMRLDVPEQRVGKIDAQKVGQNGIGAVEIHACRVGRKQARLGRHIIPEKLMHFEDSCSFRPVLPALDDVDHLESGQ